MEGPFLMACARNSWQKLGNIGSEEAMHRYIAVVSEISPSWAQGTEKVNFGPFQLSFLPVLVYLTFFSS